MRYNAPDTVYFTEARRLLSYGLKLLSKEKLMVMRGNFEFMRGITLAQMGLTVKVCVVKPEELISRRGYICLCVVMEKVCTCDVMISFLLNLRIWSLPLLCSMFRSLQWSWSFCLFPHTDAYALQTQCLPLGRVVHRRIRIIVHSIEIFLLIVDGRLDASLSRRRRQHLDGSGPFQRRRGYSQGSRTSRHAEDETATIRLVLFYRRRKISGWH